MADTIPQVAVLWDYISSAYTNFQDKQLVEQFWMAMGAGIQLLYDNVGNAQTSRVMDLMEPTFDYGPQRYIIAYSGLLPDYVTSSGTNIEIPAVTTFVPGAENITNTGFEINTSGWTLSAGTARDNSVAHTGSWSLEVPGNYGWASYNFPGRVFAPIHFEAWVYLSAGYNPQAAVYLLNENGLITIVYADPTIIDAWQKISSDHVTSPVTAIFIFNPGNVPIWVDDVSLAPLYPFVFQIDEWTYSIPTIEYNYTYNGITYSGIYTEGVDYIINKSLNNVMWLTTPTPDQRYSGIGVINGVAPHIFRINPVLANVWCRAIGLDLKTQFPNYETFGQDDHLHLKMFTWALATHRRAAPSIYTLENAYGIAHGLPFAYASGILSWAYSGVNPIVTVGSYTYTFPSGLVPVTPGPVDTFQVIAQGLKLWDYTTNAGLINQYSNQFNRNNILVYQLDPSLSGLSYAQDFLMAYIQSVMPKQVTAVLSLPPVSRATASDTILPVSIPTAPDITT